MKVLFVAGEISNVNDGISPIIFSQGESLKKAGVQVEYLILKGKSFWKYIKGVWEIRNKINTLNIDIIHAHYSYAGWSSLWQNRVPVVVSLMGSDVLEKPNLIRHIYNLLMLNKVVKKASSIICKTTEIKEHIQRDKSVFCISNGVNVNFFIPMDKNECRRKLSLLSDKKYILFPSNPSRKEKNFKLAERVFTRLNYPNVELIPVYNKSQKEILLYYNACDVLLFTSLYEGSPNVIKEALACNMPIVSVDVGDVRKNLTDVKNCYVSDYDADSLKNCIISALSSNEISNGRNKVLKEFNEIDTAKMIIEMYNKLID